MIEDEQCLTCKLCQQSYTKKERCPRRLLCGHTLCTSCLATLIQTKNRKCPSCLRPFLASSETQLPTDFTLYKKIAYSSPETETDSQQFSTDNKFTLNSPVQANKTRHGPISKDQFQLSGQLGNLSTHHQSDVKDANSRRVASPTSPAPAPFKYELPLIARSSSTMVRLPAYTGLGGYDEVDAPRERVQVDDISQEDIQTIPPPASTMYPLPPSPITQVPQQTPLTRSASSDQGTSTYQSMQTENLRTDISKDLPETPGSFQLPTPSIRTNVENHPTTLTPDIKPTFSDELPKPIKRSVTTFSPPIPAVRSSLTQQLPAKPDQNADKIPDATKQNSDYSDSRGQLLNSVSTPTQLPPTSLTSNVFSNTDVCDLGNSIKVPSYLSLKQTQSAKWKPLSTSSPLSWENTKQSSHGNIPEGVPTAQKTALESVSRDLSNSDVIAQNKRPAKRPAPNPNALTREPFPSTSLSKGASPSLNSKDGDSSKRTRKVSTKQRAPNPKPVTANLPAIYSPQLYKPSNATSVNSGAMGSPKQTEGVVLKNSKRKAPNPVLQNKPPRHEISLVQSTSLANNILQEPKHSDQQNSQEHDYDENEHNSRPSVKQGQSISDQITSDSNQLSRTIPETLSVIQIQTPQKSNAPTITLPFSTADSKTQNAATPENISERTRAPTPPSPSTIPVSSEDDKKDLNESSNNTPTMAIELLQRPNKSENRDDSQGSRTLYKLGYGPVPFKPSAANKDTANNMMISDTTKKDHSQYISRIKSGELRVGEVPSVQGFENDTNFTNTPKLREVQQSSSSSSLDTHQNSGIQNNLDNEETSKSLKFPAASHQDSKKPVKRYISPLTETVHIFASHDLVKHESVTVKYPNIDHQSFTLNQGYKESFLPSSENKVNISKGRSKSSKQAKSSSENSSSENLTHDESVHKDTDTEEQKNMKYNHQKVSSEKKKLSKSRSGKQHSPKHSNQKIIYESVTAALQPTSNHSRDMKSEVSKLPKMFGATSDKRVTDNCAEASFSAAEEESEEITKKPHDKYHENVESELGSIYSSNEDEDQRPKSNKHSVLKEKNGEPPRRSNSSPKRKTDRRIKENYMNNVPREKNNKQYKREPDKTQLRREEKKSTGFKAKQKYRNEEDESDKSDINLKLQRARHRLKSTLDEPKSASSYKEKKTRQGKDTVPTYLSKKTNGINQWGHKSRTESRVKDTYTPNSDQEQSESHSDIPERRTNKTKELSNSESGSEETESEDEMKINSKGMIVRYPTGNKFPQSHIKDYTTETTPRTRKQKIHHRHDKHGNTRNPIKPLDVENFTESADEIAINSKGMIMRIPSSNRRQPSQKQNETRPGNSDIKRMNQGKSRRYQKMHHPQTESGETSGSDNSSKTHRDTSDINLLVQRARHSLKSVLDVDSKQRAKVRTRQEKSEKRETLLKESSDSDSEITNHRKSKSRARKENRATANESRVKQRENSIYNYPASMPYDTSHDMYKYDERIPKRFYSRVNLIPSDKESLKDRQDNYQTVLNPAFKVEEDTVSENENSETYLASSKFEAQKRKKEAIMPIYDGLEGNASVSSEEFPTDIYADFKPDNHRGKAPLSNDDSDIIIDTTRRKVTKSSVTKSNSFLKRTLALTDSKYKSSFHYRPSSQIYTAELALVTNPEDGKTENVKDLGKEMQSMDVGQCKTHGALMDLYCKTCELWVCRECLDVVHRPPPEGHCQTVSSDQAVQELKESHAELFDAKIATLEHFKEELHKLLENCEKSLKDHEISIAQLSSRVLSEKMIIQGIENMKSLVQQKCKQVEQWEDVLEANALRIGQSASSGEIEDAMERNKSEILIHVMQGMTGEKVLNQTANPHLW